MPVCLALRTSYTRQTTSEAESTTANASRSNVWRNRMKHRNAITGFVCVACLTACGMEQAQLGDPSEIEGRISQFYDDIAAYDFEAMRAAYAPGVVILDGGQRLDGDGFEALVAGLECPGDDLDFAFSQFDTKVGSDTAHTSYEFTSPPDSHWYGAAHYRVPETRG